MQLHTPITPNGVLQQGFIYQDQLKPIAEVDAMGTVVSRFVYATKMNVPDYLIKGGITYRIISDQLGSPRMIVDTTTGNIVQQLDYDEFGNILTDTQLNREKRVAVLLLMFCVAGIVSVFVAVVHDVLKFGVSNRTAVFYQLAFICGSIKR